MKYDKIKEYKLSHQQIARMFGYKNVNSFRSSSAHQRIMKGIDEVLKHIDKNSLPTFVLLKEDAKRDLM